ncbi:MAG: hypothetical protein C4540_04530 [Candidatus Omnitrophota bacterium]|jgi:hypothetical protein|nr:MAG: hypothetical protein C4540_04530 [Candidatus Omnitrophota bacterium]
MKLELSFGGIIAAWYFLKRVMHEISKIAEPICEDIEKMALDGVIDKAERKALAMKAIALAEQQGKIKLNFLSRRIVSFMVDRIASKLPDFKISQESKGLIAEARKQ